MKVSRSVRSGGKGGKQRNTLFRPYLSLSGILAAHGGHGMRAADLNMMVRQINETEVSPEDRLSDKVQYYSRSARTLMNAAEYERSHDREQASIKDKSI